MIFSDGNMSPEDDTEIASDEIPITRFPAIVSRTEWSLCKHRFIQPSQKEEDKEQWKVRAKVINLS